MRPDLEGLQVVLSVGLRRLPCGIRPLVLDVIDLKVEMLVEGRAIGRERLAHLHTLKHILAYIERSINLVEHRDCHDWRAGAHEFSNLGIYLAHLSLGSSKLYRLAHICRHLLHGTFRTLPLCRCGTFLFSPGTVDSHVILAFGSLLLCLHRLVCGVGLVSLLRRHHPFVIESLHSLVAFLCHIGSRLCLLPHLVGAAHLLLACSALCHLCHGGCRVFGS